MSEGGRGTLTHQFLIFEHNGLCIIQVITLAGRCITLYPHSLVAPVIPLCFPAFVSESAVSLISVISIVSLFSVMILAS